MTTAHCACGNEGRLGKARGGFRRVYLLWYEDDVGLLDGLVMITCS